MSSISRQAGPSPLHYSAAEVAEGWAGDDDLSVLLWLAARELIQLCRRLLATIRCATWHTWSQP